MMKKLAMVVLGGLLSASVLAAPMGEKRSFTGATIGTEVGTSQYKLKNVNPDVSFKKKNTADVSLTGGYGFEYGDTNFVGEVGGKVKLGSSKTFEYEDKANNEKGSIKEKNRYSIGYTQGYRATDDLMPYVKAEYLQNQISDSNSSKKHTMRGYGVGVGAKYAVLPNMELGVEYMHSQQRGKKDESGERLKTGGNHFNTGVSYRF